ncbi:hypothetical protein [Pseudomonas phage PA1C]|uniref:Uncharacterized protein n=1 Tax=Pseudomonas phage vB_PaeM_PS119XW TaxID=2601632 RepID=A0A5C1K796_9CAUD|nr:hypothetical protein PP933_gp036 [Pseudomonas phage vB_PaeM_PS119XW]QBX32187.1 hypothetical protein [Pseudomonas phage PA1C]QEM41765.1 hypothetical protein [Pseudomonas phage vB_PaeM_PS119XW]BEG72675.1 hypothetical protein RVBP21_3030 [Pseudomonas phage BRkr]
MNSHAYKTVKVLGRDYRVTSNSKFVTILDARGNMCFNLNVVERKATQPCESFRRYCAGVGVTPKAMILSILNNV